MLLAAQASSVTYKKAHKVAARVLSESIEYIPPRFLFERMKFEGTTRAKLVRCLNRAENKYELRVRACRAACTTLPHCVPASS